MKHTKGPWKMEEHKGSFEVWSDSIFVLTTDSKLFKGATECGEAKGNAQLAAAAPELLEALESQRLWLKEIQMLYGLSEDLQGEIPLEIKRLELVIAKARGGK